MISTTAKKASHNIMLNVRTPLKITVVLAITVVAVGMLYHTVSSSDSAPVSAPAAPTSVVTDSTVRTPATKTITATDAQLAPYRPSSVTEFEFHKNNDVWIKYHNIGMNATIGVTDGVMWLDVPMLKLLGPLAPKIASRVSLVAGCAQVDSSGRAWLTAIPPWFPFNEFDPDLTGLPRFISVKTEEGKATVVYYVR